MANPDKQRNRALRKAVKSGDAGAVELLLSEGADPNYTVMAFMRVNTLLGLAIMENKPQVIAPLLKAGADPDADARDGAQFCLPPTLLALRYKRYDCLEAVLDNARPDLAKGGAVTPGGKAVRIGGAVEYADWREDKRAISLLNAHIEKRDAPRPAQQKPRKFGL